MTWTDYIILYANVKAKGDPDLKKAQKQLAWFSMVQAGNDILEDYKKVLRAAIEANPADALKLLDTVEPAQSDIDAANQDLIAQALNVLDTPEFKEQRKQAFDDLVNYGEAKIKITRPKDPDGFTIPCHKFDNLKLGDKYGHMLVLEMDGVRHLHSLDTHVLYRFAARTDNYVHFVRVEEKPNQIDEDVERIIHGI